MAQRAAQLRLEEAVHNLIARLEQLELRVSELEESQEFELVREEPPRTAVPVSRGYSSPVAPVLSQERLDILSRISNWLRSCLSEERRGLSGRELLPEGNRYYLVVRSFRGEVFDPVRVFDSLSQAVPVVKPLGHPGESIFIGLPSLQDGRVICEAAGLGWPSNRQ